MNQFPESIPWSKRSQLPEVSAVYGICSPQGELLYVGSTENPLIRMKCHHRRKMICDEMTIRWRQESSDKIRQLEKLLIINLIPPWNNLPIPKEMRGDSRRKIPVMIRITESENEYIENIARLQGGSSKAEVIRQIIAKAQMLQEP